MLDDPNTCQAATIDELLALYATRADTSGREVNPRDLIARAYQVALNAHEGQRRKSGEPYITHPFAVAQTLACMRLDAPTIAAALLHDVAEDTSVTIHEIRQAFGDEIANLVDSVTKISRREALAKDLHHEKPPRPIETSVPGGHMPKKDEREEAFFYRTDREAESLRKMFLGIANDVRVVLIKLADRLHNMQTLEAMAPEKRKKIGRETLEIYAPLANRLGMWEWKQMLEELGFRYAEPDIWLDLTQRLEEGASERNASVNHQIERLKTALAERGFSKIDVTGRAKQPYSIWRKMQKKKLVFDQIMDLRAIRVIIEDQQDGTVEALLHGDDPNFESLTEEERQKRLRDIGAMRCYDVLYVAHNLWKPIRSEFDDYIAKPKNNHYQSLHTAVVVEDGRPLEVQIRTKSMHQSAEYGVAAHWLYKEREVLSPQYQQYLDAWRDDLKALSNSEDDAASFTAAAVQANRELDDKIYCFTPKGRLIELPRGATVLDFAYHIHTDLGHRCRGGWVNGVYKPINYALNSDDQIEIVTKSDAVPSRNWLSGTVITSTAKNKIRTWFRRQERTQNIAAGRQIVEQVIKRTSAGHALKAEEVFALFKPSVQSMDEFLEKVGWSVISIPNLTSRVIEEQRRRQKEREARPNGLAAILPQRWRSNKSTPSATVDVLKMFCVAGTYDVYATPASCCNPKPGDDLIGYTTRGEGVKVHRRDCKNLADCDPARFIEVTYGEPTSESVPVEIAIEAVERGGLLNEVTDVTKARKANIIDMSIPYRNKDTCEVRVWIKTEVANFDEAGLLMSQLLQIKHVFDVYLTEGKEGRKLG